MRTNLFRQILIVGSTLAAACACAAVDPIPCAVGNHWEYDCVKVNKGSMEYQGKKLTDMYDTSSGSAVYEVLSVDNGAGTPLYSYREATTTKSTVNGRSSTEKDDMKVSSDSDALKIYSTEEVMGDENKPEKITYDPPLVYWLKGMDVGKGWDVGVIRGGGALEPLSAKVVGKETVTVPAGTFKDCLKVVYISDSGTGTVEVMGMKFNITSGKSRGIYWIADGVGVVKELEVSTSAAQAPGPAGGTITLDGGTCTINELRPGYVVK